MSPTAAHFGRFAYALAALYASMDNRMIRETMEQAWLQITDNTVALQRSSRTARSVSSGYEERLAMWRTFGREAGLDEVALRQRVANMQASERVG